MSSLRKIHEAELEVLKDFIKICDENNLRCMMLGGTMLGAVRHKGFIPWDDDIDMGMPRNDYERFIEIFKENSNKNLYLNYYKNQQEYITYPLKLESTKVKLINRSGSIERTVNVWIDIFPLDGMPNGNIKRKVHQIRLLVCRALMQLAQFKYVAVNYKKRPWYEASIIKFAELFPIISKVLSNSYFANEIDRLLKKYPFENANHIVNFMGAYKFREMFPKNIYNETSLYPFEDMILPGCKDYDFYLKQMYGDYMKVPEDKDKNKHFTEIKE